METLLTESMISVSLLLGFFREASARSFLLETFSGTAGKFPPKRYAAGSQ
jgi:hypothetical protein